MYDLCIHSGASEEGVRFFIGIKKEFKKFNFSVQLYTLNQKIIEFVDEEDRRDIIVLPEINDEYNVEESIEFAGSLGITNLRSLYFTQKIFHNLKEEEALVFLAKKIQSLKKILQSPPAKMYFTFSGDEMDINIFRLFARHQKGKILYSGFAGIENRVFITDSDYRYFKIPVGREDIPESEKQWVEDYIQYNIEKKPLLYGTPSNLDFTLKGIYLIKLIKKIFTKKQKNTTKTTKYRIQRVATRNFNRFFVKRFYTKDYNDLFSKPFVYFPLHYPKDSQLTLRGLPFFEQQDIIKIISKYVPVGYNLIIKEHPHALGYFKSSDLKIMVKLPNTFIVHPMLNSHDIVKKSSAVIVVNSSAGFEALMYNKPVITLGRSFYRGHGLTLDIDSLYDLEDAFGKISEFRPVKQDLRELIWKIKKYSFPLNHKKVFELDSDLTEEYVRQLLPVLQDYRESLKTSKNSQFV